MAISSINKTPKGESSLAASSLLANNNSTSLPEKVTPQDQDGMPTWAIILIVVACILLLISLCLGAYLAAKRLRDRRKNHGEYKPQQVEHLQAKDLPYITPPNIEGLI